MARILIVEDEVYLARAIASGLAAASHTIDVVGDGEAALAAVATGRSELVLLDVLLPRLSGVEVCRRMRAAGAIVPVLMLTARDATEDVVAGLDAGANDYLTKPFAFAELLARIRALLRIGTSARMAKLTLADLVVDTASCTTTRSGAALSLTPKEYQLLVALLRHQGHVVPRQRLIDALWHGDSNPDSNAIEVHVASLRKKLDGDGQRLLHTVRGFGYVLREPS